MIAHFDGDKQGPNQRSWRVKGALVIIGFVLTGCLGAAARARAAGPGDQVVVVYNTRMPESKAIAEHYAKRRQVPAGQVLGFDLPTAEIMSRREYEEQLERPLAKALRDKQLFVLGAREIPTTNGHTRRAVGTVVAAKIRYAVLCYGVPLKISPDSSLKEEGARELRSELRRNEASVDSELACLPLLGPGYMRAGPLANPFFAVTNNAVLDPTNGILLTARLDGPTAGIARSLVDMAMQAETNGLWGRAYFDLRGLTNGPYKLGDDALRGAATACRLLGFETTVDENTGTFPASFPLSQVAFYAGWYDETVSGPFTLPTVEFMPGAFAYHLHSFSAETLRSTARHWAGPLLAKGATATMGSVYEPYLSGTPNIAIFAARFIYSGFTFGEAAYACQTAISWQTTVVGDPLYRPFAQGPQEQCRELEARHSKYLDWVYLRLTNLRLANHEPATNLIAVLEKLELTHQSPVLMEKLAELYSADNQPSPAISAWREALRLGPTPQQRVRVMLTLGDRLVDLQRDSEAYAVYQQFVREFPDYPDERGIYEQLVALAKKLGKTNDASYYQLEINRSGSPNLTPTGPPLRPGI